MRFHCQNLAAKTGCNIKFSLRMSLRRFVQTVPEYSGSGGLQQGIGVPLGQRLSDNVENHRMCNFRRRFLRFYDRRVPQEYWQCVAIPA